MSENEMRRPHEVWAKFRFSVVGSLLASPPKKQGDLQEELSRLSQKKWAHPTTGKLFEIAFSTIEHWYYAARGANDPLGVLKNRIRKDLGQHRCLLPGLRKAIRQQHANHKKWSYRLHYDNLKVCCEEDQALGSLPSYSTVLRYMQGQGLFKEKRGRRHKRTAGEALAQARFEQREVRSYEAEYVNGLWHVDFHHGSRPVLTRQGEWKTAIALGVIDDRSRLVCHLQWYLQETTEVLVHGMSQALQKYDLPRACMSDNGPALVARETRRGLLELGIEHETTLPYSPYQNAKQEVFWGVLEGRLIAMLEGHEELTLDFLNQVTQPWVELDYNRKTHEEIGMPPLTRFLDGPSVARQCPSPDKLRHAFRAEVVRTQRRSDGTIRLGGQRFEIPSRFRHFKRVAVRYASWDLGDVDLVDPHTGVILSRIYPIDKTRNAEGLRRRRGPISGQTPAPDQETSSAAGIAPLLRRLLDEYTATGLPPAYLPKEESEGNQPELSDDDEEDISV